MSVIEPSPAWIADITAIRYLSQTAWPATRPSRRRIR
jgi:hypothetical protein